jgi:hypothetical protein
MGWATHYVEKLRAGDTVSFRPRGSSMKGRIESGHLCTVAPVDCSTLSVGDIVLCKVRGNEFFTSSRQSAANGFKLATIAVESMAGSEPAASLENAFASSPDPDRYPWH